jgi:hypothetical protein
MKPRERELKQPRKEESYHLASSDLCGFWQLVGNVRPLVSEYATKRHIHHTAGIVRLRAHVEYCHNHADEDEPERAIDPSGYSDVDRKPNMVECRASGVEEDDDTAQACADKCRDDDCLPGQTDRIQAGADVICGRREGYAELEGKEVPCGPVTFSRWSGLKVNIAPAAMRFLLLAIIVCLLRL